MRDPYLYEGTEVLKNKLGIRDKAELEMAEGDYTSFRLRSILDEPVMGEYDFKHFCKYHETIFGDVYDWAGIPRTIDIEKSERALGAGLLSIQRLTISRLSAATHYARCEKFNGISWT